jgi:Rps23 Pro-64 3,4-dihydroxylase Tpa1-like proline 4-hydroxylase
MRRSNAGSYKRFMNFLTIKTNRSLHRHTLKIADKFVPSKVINYSDEFPAWRRSKVVFDSEFRSYYKLFTEAVSKRIPSVAAGLGIESFVVKDIEVHLTCHNDGDYFKEHSDNGTPETNNRIITFVYYFHKVPKQFRGGELILSLMDPIKLSPINNSVVFFDPSIRHEVKPIFCPSRRFEYSRFTLNGWVLAQH